MNEKQMMKYYQVELEINRINSRKFAQSTRKVYKRYALKFAKTLIENNINFSAFKNIKMEHIKQYAAIRAQEGQRVAQIINELRGVYYYYDALNRGTAHFRRAPLLDLRILKAHLENEVY